MRSNHKYSPLPQCRQKRALFGWNTFIRLVRIITLSLKNFKNFLRNARCVFEPHSLFTLRDPKASDVVRLERRVTKMSSVRCQRLNNEHILNMLHALKDKRHVWIHKSRVRVTIYVELKNIRGVRATTTYIATRLPVLATSNSSPQHKKPALLLVSPYYKPSSPCAQFFKLFTPLLPH
jgi:hypothetical protein